MALRKQELVLNFLFLSFKNAVCELSVAVSGAKQMPGAASDAKQMPCSVYGAKLLSGAVSGANLQKEVKI